MSGLPGLSMTLDHQPVGGVLISASATLGGYDRATVRVTEADVRRIDPTQGSILSVWQENGRPLWEGRLSLPPVVRQGEARLEASGYKVAAAKGRGRLLFQTRDLGVWADPGSSPYNGTGSDVSFSTGGGVVVVPNPSTASQTLRMRAWFPDARPTRVAASTSLTVLSGVGPTGTLTTRGTGTDVSWSSLTDDMVEVRATITAQSTLTISGLRVNGEGITGDTLDSSGVLRSLASHLGWDGSGIVDVGQNVLPFDWQQGSWEEALDYVAGLSDSTWRVLDDRGQGPWLEVSDWSREWIVYRSSWADDSGLIPLELFNRVVVWWTDLGGALHYARSDASPDPLAGSYTNTHEITLADRQPDDALAKVVGATAIAYLLTPRYRGSIHVVKAAQADGGAGGPFDILPGDVVRMISDWNQEADVLLRVADAEYDEAGTSLGIDQPASAAALIGRAGLRS